MELELVKSNDPILREKCEIVKAIDSDIKELLDSMEELCLNATDPKLLAVSAPQVGYAKRATIVINGNTIYKLVNPRIVKSSGKERFFEACGSVETDEGCVGGFVDRFAYVEIEALDENGNKVEIKTDGILAVVLQHELDHLDGILYTDKLVGELKRFDSYEDRLNYRKENPLKIIE